jgi:hypothetical protein
MKAGGRKTHRLAGESSAQRAKKKLTEKSEWFRKDGSQTDNHPEGREEKEERILEGWLKDKNDERDGNGTADIPTRTVLFVENTRGGELAKRLRAIERRANGIVGFKTKIVEGVGSKLKHLLPNTNPWKGAACGRNGCIPCNQEGEKKQDCRKRNIIYESKC